MLVPDPRPPPPARPPAPPTFLTHTKQHTRTYSSELYGGLEWLLRDRGNLLQGEEDGEDDSARSGTHKIPGFNMDEKTLHAIIQELSSNSGRVCDGYVTMDEFRAAFEPPSRRSISGNVLQDGGHDGDEGKIRERLERSRLREIIGMPVPRKLSSELHELIRRENNLLNGGGGGDGKDESREVTQEDLEKFEIRCKNNLHVKEVWNSRGTMSRARVSLWQADYPSSMFGSRAGRKHKILLQLGHYGNVGYKAPGGGSGGFADKALALSRSSQMSAMKVEFGHYGSKRRRLVGSDILRPAFAKFCKRPLRYHLVWSQHRGRQNLYCWEAVAPEGYVGMGMVATTSENPPPLDAMQMVPKEWTVVSKMRPQLLWTDEGTGGRAGSLWTINRIGLFAAVTGHKAPPGPFYDFKAETFLVLDHGGVEPGGDGGESKDGEVINPLDAARVAASQQEEGTGDGEDDDMEKMLAMMRRKSLAPDEVRKLQALMMKQKQQERGK